VQKLLVPTQARIRWGSDDLKSELWREACRAGQTARRRSAARALCQRCVCSGLCFRGHAVLVTVWKQNQAKICSLAAFFSRGASETCSRPMTAIVCEGMRVRFATPHAVTAIAGMFVEETWEAQSVAQGSASSHLWRDASLLLGTGTGTGWWWDGAWRAWFALDGAHISPCLVLVPQKRTRLVNGKTSRLTPHPSAAH
jgi:hypothetical protein